MVKETLSARITQSTFEELEEYAEERGMSKSEATDRLVDKALKIENGDVEIYPVSADGSGLGKEASEAKESAREAKRLAEKVLSAVVTSYILLLVGIGYIITSLVTDLPNVILIPLGVILAIGLGYQTYQGTKR